MDGLLPRGILADEFHIVAAPPHGHVLGQGQSPVNRNLLRRHGIGARTGHFAQHRNLVIAQTHRHHRPGLQISTLDFGSNQVFHLVHRHPSYFQGTEDRIVDSTVIGHQESLQSRLGS